MAISYVGSSTDTLTAGVTSFTVAMPAGVQAGDLLILVFPSGVVVTGLTIDASWTAFPWSPSTQSTTTQLYAWWKIAGASEPSVTATWTTNSKSVPTVVAYRGVNQTTPIDTSGVNSITTSGTAVSTPSLTPTTSTEWAVGLFVSRSSTSTNKVITFTPDPALTERTDVNNSAAGSAPWVGLEAADSNAAVTLAAHSYAATASFAESHQWGVLVYLNPAAASGNNWTQTPTDDAGLTDPITTSVVHGWTQSPTDSAGLSDSATPTLIPGNNWTQTVTDSTGLTDASTRRALQEFPNDDLGLSDSTSVVKSASTAWTRSQTDDTGLTDSITMAAAHVSVVTDNAGLTDSAASAAAHTLAQTDSLQASDTANALVAHTVTSTDDAGISDAATTSAAHQQVLTDDAGSSDTVSLTGTYARALADDAGLSDSTALGAAHVLVDSAGLSDASVVVVAATRAVLDDTGLGDTSALVLDPPGVFFRRSITVGVW